MLHELKISILPTFFFILAVRRDFTKVLFHFLSKMNLFWFLYIFNEKCGIILYSTSKAMNTNLWRPFIIILSSCKELTTYRIIQQNYLFYENPKKKWVLLFFTFRRRIIAKMPLIVKIKLSITFLKSSYDHKNIILPVCVKVLKNQAKC